MGDFTHVSNNIFKSTKFKMRKNKPITFRIQGLGCCIFQNVGEMYLIKALEKGSC